MDLGTSERISQLINETEKEARRYLLAMSVLDEHLGHVSAKMIQEIVLFTGIQVAQALNRFNDPSLDQNSEKEQT